MEEYLKALELLSKLSQLSKDAIEYALEKLLCDGKIDYVNLSNAYIQSLNTMKKDQSSLLSEAYGVVCQYIVKQRKPQSKRESDLVQRALYLLNQSHQFNMGDINNKFSYNKEYARTLSCYEREKIK